MGIFNACRSLELNHDQVFNYQVEPVFADRLPFIINQNCLLALKLEPGFLQLEAQRLFIDFLKKPWPKCLVDPNATAEYAFR